MYRLILESLLGLRLEVDKLRFEPCLPAHWPSFTIHYRYRETQYHIVFTQRPVAAGEGEVATVTLDGIDQHDTFVALVDDRQDHVVAVSLPVSVK